MTKQILEYLLIDGTSPFGKWFDKLEPVAAAKVTTAQIRMQSDNFGDHRNLAGGVRECRIDHGPGYRIYLGIDGDKVVILLIGGSKKGQDKDIKLAQRYWKDYRDRVRTARKAEAENKLKEKK
jgi:putative addiction module killer protein